METTAGRRELALSALRDRKPLAPWHAVGRERQISRRARISLKQDGSAIETSTSCSGVHNQAGRCFGPRDANRCFKIDLIMDATTLGGEQTLSRHVGSVALTPATTITRQGLEIDGRQWGCGRAGVEHWGRGSKAG